MTAATDFLTRQARYAEAVAAMQCALAQADEAAFAAALAELQLERDGTLHDGVRHVVSNLRRALEQFRADSRLVRMAGRDVPDARLRLAHVIELTDKAAHRTIDLIDQCGELADGVQRGLSAAPAARQLPGLATQLGAIRGKLAEMLVAQGYQDLSGQIIRGVMKLIDELELALRELVAISGADADAVPPPENDWQTPAGPAVPGVSHGNAVDGQHDVDALLSGMGL